MSGENTSVLTFQDLILEVAYKLGIADYGSNGESAPAIPTDTHDLTVCQRIVNKAIRMFINDAPHNGWRWLRPVAQLDLWPSITFNPANLITVATFNGATNLTTFTITTSAFFPSMELRPLVLLDGTTLNIVSYISGTQVTVQGDFHLKVGQQWSITTTGDYTLPSTFGGQFIGHPTFVAGTNRGMTLHWVEESWIRERRSNQNQETGTPYSMAVRIMNTGIPRHRWEMMFYRMPGEYLSVLFPYILHFDYLVNLTDVQPAPFGHDETIKAACLAVAEKEVEDTTDGPDWSYYRSVCLANSYRVDALSAPKNLGYCGNPSAARLSVPPIREWRDNFYQRPTVPFNQ